MEMKPNPQVLATRRLRGPLLVCLVLAACGEDKDVVGDTSSQSDAQVGDTSPSWSFSINSPAEGALFAEGLQVPVSIALTGVDPSQALSFRATLTLDSGTVPGWSDVPFNAQGLIVREVEAGRGAHILTVTVTGNGETVSATREFSVNAPPDVPTAGFRSENPTTLDDLEVIDEASNDPTFLGDGVTFKYRWRKVGAAENLPSTTDTLSNIHTEKGDQIEVFITPNDGFVDGPELRLAVDIANAAPSCTGVLMLPSALNVGQSATCSCVGWQDADGDADQSTCVFTDTASGTVLETDGSCTLEGAKVEAGMAIACALTPHDGESAGTVVSTPVGGEVAVLNSRPSSPVATLSPTTGNALTEFTCELTSPGVDPDGDSVTHTTSWTVAGAAVVSDATMVTGAELGAGKGDAVCCRIAASDGSTPSVSNASCVTLENAPPPEVNIFARVRGGGSASRRSTLDCEAEGASDPDGDPITISYAWFVGGAQIPGASSSSLSAASIPRDSVVSCQATICDDAGLCTEPIASKTSVLIQNALPQVGDVQIVPDEAESHPGQTLTCAFSGWDDPDGDAAQVVYQWVLIVNGVETVLVSETSPDIDVEVTMAPGSQLVCRVTPMNGSNAGPTASSSPRLIGEAVPMAPTVAVVASAGADGPLTCQTTSAGQFIPEGATWTWRWSRNGTALDVPSSTTLAVGQVSDCDLVRCWVEIRAPGLSLDSNQGSSLMPLGADCDDGNACTSATCFMGGGCNQVATDGGDCDDGDACTENEVCQAGTCVGTLDVCREDRLSVTTATTSVRLSAHPDGGYLAIFGEQMRRTDAEGSRIEEQVGTSAYHGGSIAPSGRVARYRYHGANGVCHVNNNYVCFYYTVRVLAADLKSHTDLPVDVYCGCGATLPSGGTTLPIGEDGWAVFIRRGASVELQLIDSALNRAAKGAIANPIYPGVTGQDLGWHAAKVPDGTDAFMVVWVSSDRKTIYAQRFSALGAAEFADPIAVATTTSTFDATAVGPMANGRFVVAWQGAGLDGAGQGIMARRFDESGNALGGAFAVNEVATGDQILGGIAAFSNLRFAVAFRDGSVQGGRYVARTFSASAEGGASIVLNGATVPSAGVPSIEAMSNDDFVAAWRDSANVLWTRRYRFDGTYSQGAAEFRANDASNFQQEVPAAAVAPNGHVMMAYQSTVIGAFGTEVMARVFDEDGLEVAREAVVYGLPKSRAQTQPAVAAGPDGFLVAWNDEEADGEADGVFARRFDLYGEALGESVAVNTTTAGYQRQPAVAIANNGSWVVAWNGQSGVVGSTSDVYARIFSANAVGGAELVLNSTVANVQERPALAMVPFGVDFVAVWQSRNQDGDGLGVMARKFGLDGVAKSIEMPVNTRTVGDQRNPVVAVSQTGQVAVCWESVGQVVAAKPAIACQYLRTSDLLPVGSEFLAFSWNDEQAWPAVRFQANGRLAIAYQSLGLDSSSHAIQLVRVTNQGVPSGPRLTMNRTWAEAQTRPFVAPLDDRLFVGWQSLLQDGSEGGVFFRILSQP